jgi:hypothetical protein
MHNMTVGCKEYIQCSACYFPEEDYILTGHRHWSVDMYWNAGYSVQTHEVFDIDRAKKFFDFDGDMLVSAKDHIQGFFTSEMRFVTREEGWAIARERSQIVISIRGEDLTNLKEYGELFSENLW